jgi:hypothetical protein
VLAAEQLPGVLEDDQPPAILVRLPGEDVEQVVGRPGEQGGRIEHVFG